MSQQVLGGRYRIEGVLGRGGMAQVYKGTDTVLGRPVAIKVLAPQFAQDEAFVARFRREAQAAARLNHPNLVGVYDTGSDDGTHYIVMEHVEGRTLAEFLAGGGRLMPERAIELTEAVCKALAFAHAQGVIHRDIKPGNIMVTRQGDVKVMDFGIARLTTSAETIAQTAAVLGTASYLSPEQAQGQPVDARSDLYSLGVVMYEMLTGAVPFTGDSPVAVAYKHVQESPEPPSRLNPDVSPELEAVVMRALAKGPANRYRSAEEFRQDLERARRGQPVEAPPLLPAAERTQVIAREDRTALLPPQPPSGRGRRLAAGIAIAVVVLVALGAGLYLLAQGLLKDEEQPVLVKAPSVVGDSLQEATRKLKAAGFEVAEPERVFDDSEPGTVLDQKPAADEQAEEGSEVTLTVSKGPEKIPVPAVAVGSTPEDARAVLDAAGFTNIVEDEAASTEVELGFVIGTDPPEGTEIAPDELVTILVSSGPGEVKVPDVICFSFGAAKKEIQDAGLIPVVSTETRPPNPLCPNGQKVVETSPPADTLVEPGLEVIIYLPGPPPSPTPTATSTP